MTYMEMALRMVGSIGLTSLKGINLKAAAIIAEVNDYAKENGWYYDGAKGLYRRV